MTTLAIGSPVEHTIGIYIGLLLIACMVAIAAKLVTHLPYTIFLTLVGLAIGLLNLGPRPEEAGFGHDLIYFAFLPPLLFQGAFHMDIGRLRPVLGTVLALAVPGVLTSTLLVGAMVWWLGSLGPLTVALLFGALISPTDPVSVLSLFRETRAPHGLRTLVEGESLFNDGTGVVLFTILLEASQGVHTGVGEGAIEFAKVSFGGALVGGALGFVAFRVLRRLDDHLLENAICLVAAYGAFWAGEYLSVSGVIAAVVAGLLVGNYGTRLAMSPKTQETVESFFDAVYFVLNSILFILVGLELQEVSADVAAGSWQLIITAIAAMMVARAAVVYSFTWIQQLVGRPRPRAWSHLLFWGGLRGSIPIALLLQIPADLPNTRPLAQARTSLIVAGFACVLFSLLVQGLTMRPLIRKLGLADKDRASGPSESEQPAGS